MKALWPNGCSMQFASISLHSGEWGNLYERVPFALGFRLFRH